MTDLTALIAKIVFATTTATTPAKAPVKAPAPIVVAQAPAAAAKALTAVEIVDNVQKFYAGISQVTAKFRQTVTNSTFGTSKVSDGKLMLLKPGKMRWDYASASKKKAAAWEKSFISDGKMLYVVEYDNLQIVKKNLEKDLMPVAVSFLYGKGDLKAEFTPALDTSGTYGEKGDYVLKLTPKAPSAQYKALILVVKPDNFRVQQSIIIDSSDNKNHFAFHSPDFKTAIAPTKFDFNPKDKAYKNYRVIDADQPQTAAPGAKPATK